MSQAVGIHTSSRIPAVVCPCAIAHPSVNKRALLTTSAPHQRGAQDHDLHLALRTIADFGLESSAAQGVVAIDENGCVTGQFTVLQQALLQLPAITVYKLVD